MPKPTRSKSAKSKPVLGLREALESSEVVSDSHAIPVTISSHKLVDSAPTAPAVLTDVIKPATHISGEHRMIQPITGAPEISSESASNQTTVSPTVAVPKETLETVSEAPAISEPVAPISQPTATPQPSTTGPDKSILPTSAETGEEKPAADEAATKPTSDKPAEAPAADTPEDDLLPPGQTPSQEAKQQKEADEKSLALEKIIADEKYYLPINAAEKRHVRNLVLITLLIVVVLAIAAAAFAESQGYINIPGLG